MRGIRSEGWGLAAVLFCAALVAVASARPYAGAWNDGSRLAAVESLVDRGTWVIDASPFVAPGPRDPSPYAPGAPAGTMDRLFIRGHFYSDKSPVPSLLMAGEYWALQRLTGLVARARPDRFCRLMTLGTAGVAYVLLVGCVFLLGARLGLPRAPQLLLTACAGLATGALPYARHVNNHILLLAVAAALTLCLHELERRPRRAGWSAVPAAAGCLAGLAYTIDLGLGPVMFLCTAGYVAWRSRSGAALAAFGVGALPWLALHHAVNYAVAGTLGPANAVRAYSEWPGCPFDPRLHPGALTGGWNHASPLHFFRYAAELIVGPRGIAGHNLVLLLFLPAVACLAARRIPERPALLSGIAWSAGGWLLYAASSSNYGGASCSVRWLLPVLAPALYAVALWLREQPGAWRALLLVTALGAAQTLTCWSAGPWQGRVGVGYWLLQAAAVAGLAALARRERPAAAVAAA